MRSWLKSFVACLFLLVAVSGCEDGSHPFEAEDSVLEDRISRVSVHLTDAPGEVAAVWVDVVEIYLQGEEGRVVLLDEPTGLIELISLAGTSQELVNDVEVEPGSYQQLRFVVGGAVLETTGGSVYSKDGAQHPEGLATTGRLQCPSCSQTGIKVLLSDEDLEFQGGDEDILLDFDVTQSFGQRAGKSGMWVMRPVIHGAKMDEMGQITGTVALATDEEGEPVVSIPECPADTERSLEDFVPTATSTTLTDEEGEAVVRTGATDASGEFSITGLAPDDFQMGYLSEISFDGTTLVWNAEVDPEVVTITAGGVVTGVEYTITDAICQADETDEEDEEDDDEDDEG